jgi:hypothetical protein
MSNQNEQVKKPREYFVVDFKRNVYVPTNILKLYIYKEEPTDIELMPQGELFKVLEAAPVFEMLDKLELVLKFYSGLADEVYAVNVTTSVGPHEHTIDRGEKAEELLNELRNWRLK